MCFSSAKSSTAQSSADNKVTTDSGVAVGGNGVLTVTPDNSVHGLEGADLKNTLDFLANYASGAQDFANKALDTIKVAQVNNTNAIAGTLQSGISDVKDTVNNASATIGQIFDKLKIPLGVVSIYLAYKTLKGGK